MAENENKAVTPQSKGSAVKRTNEKLGFFARVKKWFREMRSELKKVVWPTPQQVLKNTLVVAACVLCVGVFIWLFDEVASVGIAALIGAFN